MPTAKHKLVWHLLLVIMVFGLLVATRVLFFPSALSQGTWFSDACQSLSLCCSAGELQVFASPKLLSSISRLVWGCWTLRKPQASQLPVSLSLADRIQFSYIQIWLWTQKDLVSDWWIVRLQIDRFSVPTPQANTSAHFCCEKENTFAENEKMSFLSKPILRSLSLLLRANIHRLIIYWFK